MESKKYLIDTNVVIDYLGNKLPPKGMSFINEVVDAVPAISVVSKIELLGFNAPEEHYNLLADFINDSLVMDLHDKVVEKCIEIRKVRKTKLPDAIIAATALVEKMVLLTHNRDDFKNIQELQVIDPHLIL